MQLFRSSGGKSVRHGALVDIGSGSVLVAVVRSEMGATHPTILWSYREFAAFPLDADPERALKALLAALMNAMMLLDSDGRKALKEAAGTHHFDLLQVSISAPWAYTVSQVTNYEHDEPFVITADLLEQLGNKAKEQTLSVITGDTHKLHGSVAVITRATTNITANGYITMSPIGQKTSSISLTQVSAIGQTLITSAIDDLRGKLMAHVPLERYSTMLMYHCITRDLYASMTEFCLINLTYEATELAIVRDGILHYSTHAAIGINTLIRSIAKELAVPEGEARGLLEQVMGADDITTLPEREKTVVGKVLTEYQDMIENLFHETGDALAIPKVLFLHGNYLSERFFDDFMLAAAKNATGSTHTIHDISHDIIAKHFENNEQKKAQSDVHDTATLMTAHFFHKQHHCSDFEQV